MAGGGSVIGVGSDIGGSIRLPCFFNGIFGHKTTPGERNLATESTHVFVSESNAPSIKKDLFCMIAEMIMNVFVQGWCPVKTSSLLPLAASRNTSAVAPCVATPLTSSQCSRSWREPRLTCKRGIDGSILTNSFLLIRMKYQVPSNLLVLWENNLGFQQSRFSVS